MGTQKSTVRALARWTAFGFGSLPLVLVATPRKSPGVRNPGRKRRPSFKNCGWAPTRTNQNHPSFLSIAPTTTARVKKQRVDVALASYPPDVDFGNVDTISHPTTSATKQSVMGSCSDTTADREFNAIKTPHRIGQAFARYHLTNLLFRASV